MPKEQIEVLTIAQESFLGGLNQGVDGSLVSANEYSLLVNGRVRNSLVQAVNEPLNLTQVGWTKIQGVYSANSYLVVFADGFAYYKDFSNASVFVKIADFRLSETADYIYAVLVPSSTVNYQRRRAGGSNSVQDPILYSGFSSQTPQCLVVQDGVNQPWIIFPDGTARVSLNYNSWQPGTNEYVPIGKQMLHFGGILYIVDPSGSLIYRSVTGRPLDFMVIVDETGNKLPTEAVGGASVVAHKVDYDAITNLSVLNAPDGSFFVSTAKTTYMVTPDYSELLFGEPYFNNTPVIDSGAINQFSVCDLLGDTAFIDFSGIRSFNSVGQYRFEGKNSPFSARISKLLLNKTQTQACAVSYDNYGLFYINTVFGYVFMVYDTILQQWVALDSFDALLNHRIFMLTELKFGSTRRLFCCSPTGLFELYNQFNAKADVGLYTAEYTTKDPSLVHKPNLLNLTFVGVENAGSAYVTLVQDGVKSERLRQPSSKLDTSNLGYVLPYGILSEDSSKTLRFNFANVSKAAWKTGILIQWSFIGHLTSLLLQSNVYQRLLSTPELEDNSLSIVGFGGYNVPEGSLTVFGYGLSNLTGISVNGVVIDTVSILSDTKITFRLPADWPIEPLIQTIVVEDSSGNNFNYSTIPDTGDNGNNTKIIVPVEMLTGTVDDVVNLLQTPPADNNLSYEYKDPCNNNRLCTKKIRNAYSTGTNPDNEFVEAIEHVMTYDPNLSNILATVSLARLSGKVIYAVEVVQCLPLTERVGILPAGFGSYSKTIKFLFVEGAGGYLQYIGVISNVPLSDRGAVSDPEKVPQINYGEQQQLYFGGREFCFVNDIISDDFIPDPEPDPCFPQYPSQYKLLASGAYGNFLWGMSDYELTGVKTEHDGTTTYNAQFAVNYELYPGPIYSSGYVNMLISKEAGSARWKLTLDLVNPPEATPQMFALMNSLSDCLSPGPLSGTLEAVGSPGSNVGSYFLTNP